MKNPRTVAIITGLTVLAAGIQLLPAFCSGVSLWLSIISALPVFLITRHRPLLGPLVYWIIGIATLLANALAGIFFLLVNGPLGVSLGIGPLYAKDDRMIALVTGLVLAINLGIMELITDHGLFGSTAAGPVLARFLTIFLATVGFSGLYLALADRTADWVQRTQSKRLG